MRIFCLVISLIATCPTMADTIDHYMNIVNGLPKMEMKADPQAQAWARAARNVIALTGENIAETLLIANDIAKQDGKALFCLPAEMQLSTTILNQLIQQTYRDISSQESDKGKMTVSQVALMGLTKQYPCNTGPLMQSVSAMP